MSFEIEIDSNKIMVENGMTILDSAKKLGIQIPTLCHQNSTSHKSSCMVCAVFDVNAKTFIPSCATKVREGLVIDASSEKVLEFRKKVLELILQEHKGDCIAPCQKSCPYNFNIPLFLEYVSAGNQEAIDEILKNPPNCDECKQSCMFVCRRKLIDKSVDIVGLIKKYRKSDNFAQKYRDKRYAHSLRKPSKEELQTLLDSSTDANSCLQCHCRKADDCQLRDLATEFNISAQKPLSHRNLSRVNSSNFVYESSKCILCGSCLEDGNFTLWGRGNAVKPILLDSKEISKNDFNRCPVGAISKNSTKK